MADREKVIRGLECCKWSRQNVKPEKIRCDECPYKDKSIMSAYSVWRSCTNVLAADALALLLNERGAKVKPQFDDDALDRNTYIKVGDLIDCMTELSMPEDAAFHLAGAIEWACGKRAVALPKEQEARVVNVGDFYGGEFGYLEYRSDRSGFSNFEPSPVLIGDIDEENVTVIFRSASVQKLQLDRMNKNWRIWSEYPTHELLRTVKWDE